MELFVIITAQKQLYRNSPVEYQTAAMTATVGPATTRLEVFQWARGQLPEYLRDAVVVFYSAEPLGFGAPGTYAGPTEPAAIQDSTDLTGKAVPDGILPG